MRTYHHLQIGRHLLPSLVEELWIIFSLLATSAGLAIYLYIQKDSGAQNLVDAHFVTPLNQFLYSHNIANSVDSVLSFTLYATIGVLVYCLIYTFIVTYVELYNEKLVDNFHHPTNQWHHWGRFFSVEVIKVMLILLSIASVITLFGSLIPSLYNSLFGLLNSTASSTVLTTLKAAALIFLLINGLIIIVRTYKATNL